MTAAVDERKRLRLVVRGAVQGVGFRPFVYRLATELCLTGWARNSPEGVLVEVEGAASALDEFMAQITRDSPPHSRIESFDPCLLAPAGYRRFEIRDSESVGERRVSVLPDLATCGACRREIFDPSNRRYLYPFTNCTQCGPRFSIIDRLPYDRANTTMARFRMCSRCRAEYGDPGDRRFHAQPNACPDCGPHLELWDERGRRQAARHEALLQAAAALREGKIVAVKGLGGFHLLADAGHEHEEVVQRLRQRKRREAKPFALMYPSVARVKGDCELSSVEERLLGSSEAPIVLLRRTRQRAGRGEIAPSIAPGSASLGVLLPYTPLHHLLMAELGTPVVATSGNLSDEPICIEADEALVRLGGIADLFLVHDRPIARPVDDSVARVLLERVSILRRARGYAPRPIHVARPDSGAARSPILAVGGHLKNTFALSTGSEVVLSQHIGDLETAEAYDLFRRTIQSFEGLYEIRPTAIACDAHPDYRSTRWAEAQGVPLIRVQHHYAHVLACMAENGLEPPVLGVAWDGTGDGVDGTIWGGEFLIVTNESFTRAAHLRQFPLPGGETAIREPRRAALGMLYELFGDRLFAGREEAPTCSCGVASVVPRALSRSDQTTLAGCEATLGAFAARELRPLRAMLRGRLQCPLTSSAGRLFDAVASLTGLCQRASFEGQAAMALEVAADGMRADACYPFEILPGARASGDASRAATVRMSSPAQNGSISATPLMVDWSPMLLGILADVYGGATAGQIAARFHHTLVEMLIAVARSWGGQTVVLTGGCFQNGVLLERAVRRLREERFRPYWHTQVPPTDGGLALGQVIAAARVLERG